MNVGARFYEEALGGAHGSTGSCVKPRDGGAGTQLHMQLLAPLSQGV